MNKFQLLTLFCLLASVAIGTEGFIQRGKTSPRRQETIAQSTQEEDSDGSDNVKGVERPDDSGSKGVPSDEGEAPAEEGHPAPEPYSFSYSADNEDGSSSTREETGDRDGTVTGFYMMMTSEGQRKVNYVADKTGFHATITTNEIGTNTSQPADVTIDSSAPEVIYPEGPSQPSGGSVSTSSGSRSTGSRSVATSVTKTDVVDDSSSDDDDFGSASAASRGSTENRAAPRPTVTSRRGSVQGDSQIEDNEEEVEAPAPAPAPRPAPRPQPRVVTPSQPIKTRPIAARPQPAPRAPQPTKTSPTKAPRPQPAPIAPRPAPRPVPRPVSKTRPTPSAPISRPAPRPAPSKTSAPRPRPVQPRPAPRPAPAPVTKTAKRPAPVQPAPRPAPRPAPVQRRPAPTPVAPVRTAQENVDDEEDSFGSEGNEQVESSNAQYMVFPLNGVNKPEIANLINNRRIVAANRDSLYLNENQLRNLLAVSRYRS